MRLILLFLLSLATAATYQDYTGTVTSTDDVRSGDAYDYPREVKFDEPIATNTHGGTGMFFTGTVGVNAMHVTGRRATWD